MTDQILTGTNPAADARLIADVMQAPNDKLKPQGHGQLMLCHGIEGGIVAVLKALSQHRCEVRKSGDHDLADSIGVAVDFLIMNRNTIREVTEQEYLAALNPNRR